MVQHHVADVGDVHALAESGRGHQHRQRVGAEQLFDTLALGACEARVVEADERRQLGHPLAQSARHGNRLLARVHVDDRLAARRDEIRQVVVAVLEVALVVHLEVGTRSRVVHAGVHRQLALDGGRHLVVGRGRKRQHRGSLAAGLGQLRNGGADGGVGHALARLRQADMVRLVHHDEAHAARGRELVSVPRKELGRGQHDVVGAVGQAREALAALVGRALARQRDHADAERVQRLAQVERLISDQRAQRVHEQAGLVVRQRARGGVHLEGQRFAAPRGHDAQRGAPGAQMREDLALRVVQRLVADDGTHDGLLERRGVFRGLALPAGAVRRAGRLVGLHVLGAMRRVRAQLGVARGVQVGHEAEVLGVEAGLQGAAGARGSQRLQHGLHRLAAAPFVDLHLERGVHHAVGAHERFDVRAVEHDARHRGAPVGQRAREVVLLGAHRAAVRQHHVARQVHGHGMLLAERRQLVQLRHVVQRQLVEADARVDFHERMERALGQRVHVGAQAPLELRQLVGRQRDAHGRIVPAEAREQVGCAFHSREQADLAHAAAAAARFVAVDGEQQAGHAVRVHQAACHDALHALVPALARHHQRALAVVDLGGLRLRDLGQLGFDGAALVVHRFQLRGQAVRLLEVVGHQQVERQLRVAHAAGGVEARDDGEAEVRGADGLVGGAAGGQQRGDARARRGVHARDAVGHEGAVLVAHGHEVGHRAQRGEVGEVAP